ncbi:MAG: phosphoribosylformylglycinamidine synthase [Clostridia bacterium]|nr:phosphoribosylformylglycinamidine synthase [Clostridia bacterium]
MRIFVEKRKGFDVEAGGVLSDIRSTLGILSLDGVRLINRYDVQGLTAQEFEKACSAVLSEPNADTICAELEIPEGSRSLAVEYLPGQYDQRADSAAQCIALLTCGEQPAVASAKVYIFEGELTDDEYASIKAYLINPVESREASMAKPDDLNIVAEAPADIQRITGFIGWSDVEVAAYHKSMGFAMTAADLCFCRDYFKNQENRDPSVTELKVIDTYWSDHCRHTTFLTRLEKVEFEQGGLSPVIEAAWNEYLKVREDVYAGRKAKDITLMDMGTIGAKSIKKAGLLNDLDESEEINACSIEVTVDVDGKDEQWLVQFKNETHNHPTEIEPFGGAATCLGGAIRDPLSGRAYVYQAMRVTGSGDPTESFEDTLEGKLPQRKITIGAAAGYSSYGNQIGLATGQVVELYDNGYKAKRMEIGAVVGASPKENVKRETPEPGDCIVLLGGRTGRDGCGGATGSSKAHNTESIETCGAEVQKGNPPTERKLQRLFRNPDAAKLIRRCNDFGAGGVCVAIGELADGLKIELDKVTKKYDGLDGTELAISESQERMAVVLAAEDVEKFIALAATENLEATVVAVVSEEARLVMHWRGDKIVDISREFLNTNGVTQTAQAKIAAVDANKNYRELVPAVLADKDGVDALETNLGRLEVCSQIGLSERFDASIGAATVNMPFAGKTQLTPEEAMCAKLPVPGGKTDSATAMSYGFIPALSRWSPFHAAAYSVTESLAKLAAIGADPSKARLTFQEYFERLNSVPERWGKPAAALLGALTAQLKYGIPSIGGKDSMSGSFNELDVPPTLVSFAITMAKASKVSSAAFKKAGSRVYLVELPVNKESLLPEWDKAMALMKSVYENVACGSILSASVVKEGGASANVCKMAFGNLLGFAFEAGVTRREMYAPLVGSFVIECEGDSPVGGKLLGVTKDDAIFTVGGERVPTQDLIAAWTDKLEGVFATDAACPTGGNDVALYTQRSNAAPAIKVAKPKVIIPVFPGTNCEYDSARAFENAGAEAEILVIKNLTASDIEQSMEAFVKAINASQIIMLPGGFSGGDEPDGSGKFIATALKNPRVKEAVTALLEQRDGLMLGICNGFQALIKTGLVPYGKIVDTAEDAPTLTYNTIGRHISHMAYTRVTSVKSPWFSMCKPGDIHAVPVSHGEGRFVADEKHIAQLIANGQIATQYVDINGKVADALPFNPNGSVLAIEGITSPDGRVLGKMAHSERKGTDLYKNVPFAKDQKIFESGVAYFK